MVEGLFYPGSQGPETSQTFMTASVQESAEVDAPAERKHGEEEKALWEVDFLDSRAGSQGEATGIAFRLKNPHRPKILAHKIICHLREYTRQHQVPETRG